ncbi:lipid-A-disaccharide synthase [Chitinophaga sp. GCM10012297]|uniref:Lipid-A-disaccharide synthase n=1 Tax=Chitinophaga chungangae TaxID=2821488 RepID=A0ABS3YKJ5_9BACT|nr:lipid-A-disaccharide synthase [Chitinophaga chungangae]MBO9154644.1 lipid-A-disaccharide synthase [Chitinophaga chungangae]
MKYYLIAGEASGDLHGSNLIKQLKLQDPQADVRCWGGDLMEQAGATVVKHYRELAFMGFVEVVMNLRTIFKNLDFCKKDIEAWKPDVLVLIDYPGFNLRIAEWAKQQGLKVIYYISPQVWAWKEGRVKKIRETVDKMLVILPFEKDFYKKWDFEVEYVGHPLIEAVKAAREAPAPPPFSDKPIIALLPGSRKQEVEKKLPVMLSVAKYFPEYQFVMAQAPSLEDSFINHFTAAYPNVSVVKGKTYPLLLQATAALVTSGTATLETALFGVPEVVCYKGSPVSYFFAKRLIKVKYISLVNLIMDKPVVKELIQHDLTEENLLKELTLILKDTARHQQMKADYATLWTLLGDGTASRKAAEAIVSTVK